MTASNGILFWIERPNTKFWHAWPQGGLSSLCGHITKESLRKLPAKRILPALPPLALACRLCARNRLCRNTTVDREGLPKDTDAAQWLVFLRRHLITQRIRISVANEHTLATHLATLGPPSNPEAVQVYNQIRALLLTPRPQPHKTKNGTGRMYKITRLKETLAALPPDAISLQHVANAMQLWRRITGRGVDPKTERYQSDTVVETMLAIPNLEAYIINLHNKGHSSLAQMFHPGTLSRARKAPALRGALDRKTQEYWAQVKGQLNIVEE